MNEYIDLHAGFLFKRQFQHILLLAGLIPGAIYVGQPLGLETFFLGISGRCWFYAAITVVVIHQLLAWFVFRTQLVFALLSRLFGKYDMVVWTVMFMPLLVMRPLLTIAVAMADAGSLDFYRPLQVGLGVILLVPSIYTLWSVHKFFGIPRALGGDHFRKEYREMPLVTEGAFRYNPNAMYAFAFLALWSVALLAGSRAALAVALFQHAYIWVHMYCTEEPDMRVIYGQAAD